jgi:hypothetical protein
MPPKTAKYNTIFPEGMNRYLPGPWSENYFILERLLFRKGETCLSCSSSHLTQQETRTVGTQLPLRGGGGYHDLNESSNSSSAIVLRRKT